MLSDRVANVRASLARDGFVPAIQLRNARKESGLSAADVADLPWHKTLKCDRANDRYVVVSSISVWLERRLLPVHQWLLRQTKDRVVRGLEALADVFSDRYWKRRDHGSPSRRWLHVAQSIRSVAWKLDRLA